MPEKTCPAGLCASSRGTCPRPIEGIGCCESRHRASASSFTLRRGRLLCETRRGPSGGIDCQRKTKGWASGAVAPRLFACTDAWWRVADHGLLAEQDLPAAESHFGPGRGSNGGFWSQKVENTIFQKGIETLSPPPHYSPLYPIVRTDRKTMSSATKAVSASSAMLPPVTAQTVASEYGAGGGMSR
jgi:hypothetical protein